MDYYKTIENNINKYNQQKNEIKQIYKEIENFSNAIQGYAHKNYDVKIKVMILGFMKDPRISTIAHSSEFGPNFICSYPYLCFCKDDNIEIYEYLSYFKMNASGYTIVARLNQKEKLIDNLPELQNFLNELIQDFSFFSKLENIVEKIKNV